MIRIKIRNSIGTCMAGFILAAGMSAPVAAGADKDLAATGKAIVEKLCSRCHAVGKDDTSTLPIAPPFRTFASKWPVESLEEALAEGIITGHPGMPVFEFNPNEIAAIIEHLHEISEKGSTKAQ